MEEDLIKAIKEAFGGEPICFNINGINQFTKKIKRERTIKMINDVESFSKNFDNGNGNPDIDAVNACIVLFNIIKFDNEDAELVGVENIQRLSDSFEVIRQKFNSLAVYNLKRLDNMIKDLSNEKDENTDDLDNLTKEELIARLRKKNK